MARIAGFRLRQLEWVAHSGNPPPPEHEQFPNDEKRPKDHLVAPSQPKRQVDIKVVRAIPCVVTGQISQRATAPVHREDRALGKNQSSQNGRPSKLTPGTSEGNPHDASGEEEPNRRVQELYPYQDEHTFRMGFPQRS